MYGGDIKKLSENLLGCSCITHNCETKATLFERMRGEFYCKKCLKKLTRVSQEGYLKKQRTKSFEERLAELENLVYKITNSN